MVGLSRFLQGLVRLRREQPGNDLVTALVQAEEEGDGLSEDELIAMVFLLLFTGHETTVNLIGNGVLELREGSPTGYSAPLDDSLDQVLLGLATGFSYETHPGGF